MSTFRTSGTKLLFTSESVTEGHPDKVCDQISDAVLDAILAQDPRAAWPAKRPRRPDLIVVFGEITTTAYVDFESIARETLRDIGYTIRPSGSTPRPATSMVAINEQSPDIEAGVDQRARESRWQRSRSVRPDRRRRPGHDDRLRLQRDAGADADADRAGAPTRPQPDRGAQVRRDAVAAAGRQEPGDGRVPATASRRRVDTVVVSTQHVDTMSQRARSAGGDRSRSSTRSCRPT